MRSRCQLFAMFFYVGVKVHIEEDATTGDVRGGGIVEQLSSLKICRVCFGLALH